MLEGGHRPVVDYEVSESVSLVRTFNPSDFIDSPSGDFVFVSGSRPTEEVIFREPLQSAKTLPSIATEAVEVIVLGSASTADSYGAGYAKHFGGLPLKWVPIFCAYGNASAYAAEATVVLLIVDRGRVDNVKKRIRADSPSDTAMHSWYLVEVDVPGEEAVLSDMGRGTVSDLEAKWLVLQKVVPQSVVISLPSELLTAAAHIDATQCALTHRH